MDENEKRAAAIVFAWAALLVVAMWLLDVSW